MLNTPVLFIVFNRPETTRQVFEAIRKVQPKQLFVAADGPRPDKPGEKEKCEEVRKIATAVDWDCEVKTLFWDENLGCGKGPATAITWFFENVEQGIILEDDCLPDLTFFSFCEILLDYYKDNEKIMHISGSNIQQGIKRNKFSYYFSAIPHMWGWATWRRAWKKYSYIPYFKFEEKIYKEEYWRNIFKKIQSGELNTVWDYQWVFTLFRNQGLSIVPDKNLIINIGFGNSATHSTNPPYWYKNVELQKMENISHPTIVSINDKADKFLLNLLTGKLSISDRVKLKLAKL
jgi:hypothetical protein